jgi:hypothetical protein
MLNSATSGYTSPINLRPLIHLRRCGEPVEPGTFQVGSSRQAERGNHTEGGDNSRGAEPFHLNVVDLTVRLLDPFPRGHILIRVYSVF